MARDDTIEVLKPWRTKQADNLGECDYIFTSNTKKQLDSRGIRMIIEEYSIKANITNLFNIEECGADGSL